MKTIARNARRKIAQIATEFTVCTAYDEATGNVVPSQPQYAWTQLERSPHARLHVNDDQTEYTVHVHSNLWFRLRRPEAQATTGTLRCEIFVSERAGHCTAPAVRVAYVADDPTTRLMACEAHPQAMNGFASPGWNSITPKEYEAAYGPLVQDAPIIGGRKAPQD